MKIKYHWPPGFRLILKLCSGLRRHAIHPEVVSGLYNLISPFLLLYDGGLLILPGRPAIFLHGYALLFSVALSKRVSHPEGMSAHRKLIAQEKSRATERLGNDI